MDQSGPISPYRKIPMRVKCHCSSAHVLSLLTLLFLFINVFLMCIIPFCFFSCFKLVESVNCRSTQVRPSAWKRGTHIAIELQAESQVCILSFAKNYSTRKFCKRCAKHCRKSWEANGNANQYYFTVDLINTHMLQIYDLISAFNDEFWVEISIFIEHFWHQLIFTLNGRDEKCVILRFIIYWIHFHFY